MLRLNILQEAASPDFIFKLQQYLKTINDHSTSIFAKLTAVEEINHFIDLGDDYQPCHFGLVDN